MRAAKPQTQSEDILRQRLAWGILSVVSEVEQALAIVNKFLADNPNLDRELRLKILENVDLIERAIKIRSKFARN